MGFRGSIADAGCSLQSPLGPACVAICRKAGRIAPQALPDTWRVIAGDLSPGIRREHPPLPGDALIESDLRCGMACRTPLRIVLRLFRRRFPQRWPRAGAMRGGWVDSPMWSRIFFRVPVSLMKAMLRI